MSQLFVDDVVSKEGTNSVGFSKGISVSVASTFSGNVSIAGTLTYEDVTSVDVVGLITARGGIKLGAAGIGGTFNANGDTTLAGVVTATSFVGNLTGDVTGTASNASGATGDFSIADKIIHTGDTNTALRFPAADTITAETGGVERLRITSAGNVGIGEDDPSTKLSLESADGSISNGILIGAKNASGIRGVVEVHSAADTIGFNLSRTGGGSDTDLVLLRNVSSAGVIEARNASNASKVYLNSNGSSYLNGGNIGINTVTPQQMLDVRGSAVIGIDQRSGNPGTTVGILTVRGHHVNSDSDYAQLYLSNSLSSGTASGKILLSDIDQILKVLKKQAKKYKYTPCIGIKRNRKRLVDAIDEISTCAISGAVGTFANINPNVEKHVAKKLGLKVEPISTQVIPRDRHAFYFSVLGIIAGSVERVAIEIRHLQRTEVYEVQEFFSKDQKGSSAMPHKKNPILSENLTGLARMVRSAV